MRTKHRLLLLEGTDGVGKSEYANYLHTSKDWTVRHFGAPEHKDWKLEYLAPLEEINGPTVFDRSFLGELVWPEIFGRESLFGDPGPTWSLDFRLCEILYRRSTTLSIWLVVRPEDAIRQTLEARGEDTNSIGRSILAQRKFLEIYNQPGSPLHSHCSVVSSDRLHRMVVGK